MHFTPEGTRALPDRMVSFGHTVALLGAHTPPDEFADAFGQLHELPPGGDLFNAALLLTTCCDRADSTAIVGPRDRNRFAELVIEHAHMVPGTPMAARATETALRHVQSLVNALAALSASPERTREFMQRLPELVKCLRFAAEAAIKADSSDAQVDVASNAAITLQCAVDAGVPWMDPAIPELAQLARGNHVENTLARGECGAFLTGKVSSACFAQPPARVDAAAWLGLLPPLDAASASEFVRTLLRSPLDHASAAYPLRTARAEVAAQVVRFYPVCHEVAARLLAQDLKVHLASPDAPGLDACLQATSTAAFEAAAWLEDDKQRWNEVMALAMAATESGYPELIGAWPIAEEAARLANECLSKAQSMVRDVVGQEDELPAHLQQAVGLLWAAADLHDRRANLAGRTAQRERVLDTFKWLAFSLEPAHQHCRLRPRVAAMFAVLAVCAPNAPRTNLPRAVRGCVEEFDRERMGRVCREIEANTTLLPELVPIVAAYADPMVLMGTLLEWALTLDKGDSHTGPHRRD
ncbi:hypothetical protein [Ramlibacter albus]|uniref:Uncharacterized protein n=1 Tax=Ramlibacter albus TaxID=2079448 RepID=A0A923M7E4_9BURK|nr:hypothetical protein [Ramlibacter albus]MBC5764169.1 hypothetical protein [Ramlibacter albus]